jgi:biopolymer transport protein ExbB/TolQ
MAESKWDGRLIIILRDLAMLVVVSLLGFMLSTLITMKEDISALKADMSNVKELRGEIQSVERQMNRIDKRLGSLEIIHGIPQQVSIK